MIDFLTAIMLVFCASIFLCMVQAVRGATLFDRVVSIDALIALSVAILVISAFLFEKTIFLDVAIVYALVAFIGDLAVAKYLEGRSLEE